MSSLNSMVGKQSNTYIYNGESYVSSLTNAEIKKYNQRLTMELTIVLLKN